MKTELRPRLALAALVLLFFRQAVFTNLIFARGDTLLYFYPYWDYRARALLSGRLPLWNPYLFMGAPFLANSQSGVLYPLNWPLIFFSAPVAFKISIVLHLVIAAWGAYALARRAFQLESYAAAFAAALFALGGYVTSQVEHINQLQGLAWLPLALLAACQLFNAPPSPAAPRRFFARQLSLFTLFFSLQLTAGHTQTAFITLLGCGLVALHSTISRRRGFWGLGYLGFGILFSFGLSAVQLLPTFELSQLSLRGGGLPLNEAVSFSLNPLLLGRTLLPGYSRAIFSEFVAQVGVLPLVLGVAALSDIRRSRLVLLAALLAGAGLFFAFGGYNPIYLLLARFVPGFNLFRVPARWLALWALGGALLAAYGLQNINRLALKRRRWVSSLLVVGALITLAFASGRITPPGELGPIGRPGALDLALWIAPLSIAAILIHHSLRPLPSTQAKNRALPIILLSLAELLAASQTLPFNHLTTPDAYLSIRPAMTQLLAAENESGPPARFLSLSSLTFDPGDLAELKGSLDPQLPPDAVYDAVIAAKNKEVLSPNLPLAWGIPSVDGYDGGILPLRAWANFAARLGAFERAADGRLQQMLTAIPSNDLLSLTNTRWIITDKLGDAWVDNVFYDLQFTFTVAPGQPLAIGHVPDFEATALGMALGEGSKTGVAHLTFANGSTAALPFAADPARPALRLRFDHPARLTAITLTSETELIVRGASLIDERAEAFQSLTLGPYRLVHSGDVKIYENLAVLPRAFIIPALCADDWCGAPLPVGSAIIIKYEAERVVIRTESDAPGYLILSDANYPGWVATVDGQPAEISTAYGLFRAVRIESGAHGVEFRFEPNSFRIGAAISLTAAALWLAALLFIRGRMPKIV